MAGGKEKIYFAFFPLSSLLSSSSLHIRIRTSQDYCWEDERGKGLKRIDPPAE